MAVKIAPTYGYVENGNAVGNLDNLTYKTYTAWVYIDAWNGSTSMAMFYQVFNNQFLLDNVTYTKTFLYFADYWPTDGEWRAPSNSVDTGAWYHLAVTYDGSSTANDPILYLDGVAVSVTEIQAPSGAAGTQTSDMEHFGGSVSSLHLQGRMADVRAYDRVLTPAEIKTIYQSRGGDGICYGLRYRLGMKQGADGQNVGDNQTIYDLSAYKDTPNNNDFSTGIATWSAEESIQRRRRVG